MGLKVMATKTIVHEIDRTNEKRIQLPEGMSYDTAIDTLEKRKTYEEQVTSFVETIDNGFIWDGAIAFQKAMAKIYGWAQAVPTPGFFGDEPPRMLAVDVSPEETVMVPFGQFRLPGMDGYLETGATKKNGRLVLEISATCRRKNEEAIRGLCAEARRILKTESIYKGKAFKVRFKDSNGDGLSIPTVKFLDLSRVNPEELVFSDEVGRAIQTSIFTPIENADACRRHKIPLKRGILLAGKYGTGKSLTSAVTAKKCEENGFTFLYCERADELAEMVKLAHQYQPAAIFCEDIDRVMSGERSVAIDDILNIIDGIESKGTELLVILTTNHVENINQALLRPGRLDAVINVLPPDALAVEKLIRLYGRGLVPENANLSEVGEMLAGNIPAVIREVTERAKLSAIKLGTDKKMVLSAEALKDAALTMRDQLALLAEKKQAPSPAEKLAEGLREVVAGEKTDPAVVGAAVAKNLMKGFNR